MFLGHSSDGPGAAWSPRDRELAKALLLYERSICDGCGQPAHEAQDPDKEGWYQVDTVICAGCKALATETRDDPEPGARYAVSLDPKYVKRS